MACSATAAYTPKRSRVPESSPTEAQPRREGGAVRDASRWSCEEGAGADGWALADNLTAEGAGESGGCGAAGGGGVMSDLPPAGDPGAAWATFDTLLPQILERERT